MRDVFDGQVNPVPFKCIDQFFSLFAFHEGIPAGKDQQAIPECFDQPGKRGYFSIPEKDPGNTAKDKIIHHREGSVG